MDQDELASLVERIWNWLPAFRAVAETEHLPTASDLLHVTPSALSRTIRLLEQADMIGVCSGERASLVAEQLALHQIARYSGAIDGQ